MHNLHHLRGKLDLLVPLAALLETACVTRAAERIGLSQSATSRILIRLREALDDPLLVRSGGGMTLTPRAEALKPTLDSLLEAASALLQPDSFDPASAIRDFHVIIPDVVAATILPRLLEKLTAEAPSCRLVLQPWRSQRGAGGEPELVITTESGTWPGMRIEPLFKDVDVLASATPPPDAAPLSRDHVAVIAVGLREDPVDGWLRAIGRERRIGVTVPHYLLALRLVATGRYDAILPRRMIAALGAPLGVHAAELPFEQEPEQQWLLYPPRLTADPASRWLRGLIHRVCDADHA